MGYIWTFLSKHILKMCLAIANERRKWRIGVKVTVKHGSVRRKIAASGFGLHGKPRIGK
jgi:hypothetical protein